jgi:tRNA(Ile)-lysidine synthetase-like protein
MDSSAADVVARVQQQVGRALIRLRLARSARPIVAAVSGGADSLCLLDALVAMLPRAKRRLIVGHVDHRLRARSGQDAAFVRSVAAQYGLQCAVVSVDVPALAAAETRGIEEAARVARYRALRDVDVGLAAPVVATGHTSDDLVETVLLHLLRGSGRRGLGGIAVDEQFDARALGEAVTNGPRRGLRVVRPLLGVGRADTFGYCEARGITWVTDETNTDARFLRNRLRGHLLPVMRTYNPAIDRALSRMARTMRDEDAWLDRVASGRLRRIGRQADARLGVDLTGWKRQPPAIRRRLVRIIAETFGFDEIGFEAVERALAVGSENGPARADLGGGLSMERTTDTLLFDRLDTSARARDD